jgi:DNA-directed RNA polymerase specialized sigma24 family protein
MEPAADADVALAAGGDTGAFERVYRTHVARVHGLARRMAGPEAADELTQDVFVRAWQKLGTFRGDASFTFPYAWDTARSFSRRRRRSPGAHGVAAPDG